MRSIMKTLLIFFIMLFLLSECVFAGDGKKGNSSAGDAKSETEGQKDKKSDSGQKEKRSAGDEKSEAESQKDKKSDSGQKEKRSAGDEKSEAEGQKDKKSDSGQKKVKSSTNQLTFSSGTEELKDPSGEDLQIRQDGSFDKRDVKRCRQVLGNIMIGNTGDMDLKEYRGLENISIGETVTYYQDGRIRFCVIDPSPGMCQLNGFQLYSSDDGASWQMSRFHRDLDLGDMYIANGAILYIDGIRMDPISAPVFSFDGGKTEKRFEPGRIKTLMSLPALDGYCMCYPRVRYIDTDEKQVSFDWYMYIPESPDDEICCYKTTVSFPDLKVTGEEDLSGIFKEAEKYKKDGYIFSSSGTEKLDQAAVRSRFLKEYRLAGAERTAAEISLAINEIYARHGQDFQDEEIRYYFDSRKWYKPANGKTVKDSELNAAEKANAAFLKGLEKEYRAVIRQQ